MTSEPDQEFRIDLLELVGFLWSKRWQIIGVTFLFAVAGVAYALLATPTYRSEALIMPNKSQQGPVPGASLGTLASLAGLNFGVSPDRTDAMAVLGSRVFAEEFIREQNLMPILYADRWDAQNGNWLAEDPEEWPDIRDAVQFFTEEVRLIEEDSATGLVTLAIKWTDPELAASWVEQLLVRINERIRSRDLARSERRLAYLNGELAQANLVEMRLAISRVIESELQTITLAKAESEYAFMVIDPPRVPHTHLTPRRLSIVVLATLIGGMLGTALVLLRIRTPDRRNGTEAE